MNTGTLTKMRRIMTDAGMK